jgi:excisionase family DNA binding protein
LAMYITKAEAAELMRVKPATVARWAREGRITKYKVAGLQSVRYSQEELLSLLQPETSR